MGIKKNKLVIGLLCYVMWGALPVYWNLLAGLNPLFILCCRIVFALVFTISVLLISGRIQVFRDTLKDKASMRYLVPSAVLITFNWGLYIWAVNSEHILDSSLGYYMNPLIAFLLGVIMFREKYTKLQLVAVAFAFIGVLISVVAYGSFPYISLGLALSFALYGALKKKAHADPVSGIAVETLIILPFTIIFALIFLTDSIKSAGIADLMLLIGGGAVTAIPLILYSSAVNDIPFIIIGFLQYVSPSIALIYGLISGERLSTSQIVSFIFIGLGLVVFSIALVRQSKTSPVFPESGR